jgi:ketosteroid isomerase-like protein
MGPLADHSDMSHARLVEQYYEAIDDADREALAAVLTDAFRHDRPDRTIEGRGRFVEFMMAERPTPDTVHAVDTVFLPEDTDSDHEGHDAEEVAVHGRLFNDDGSEQFAFVDLFTVGDEGISHLRTFTN